MSLQRGIQIATDAVVAELQRVSRKVKSKEDLMNVASVSANNDREILANSFPEAAWSRLEKMVWSQLKRQGIADRTGK